MEGRKLIMKMAKLGYTKITLFGDEIAFAKLPVIRFSEVLKFRSWNAVRKFLETK